MSGEEHAQGSEQKVAAGEDVQQLQSQLAGMKGEVEKLKAANTEYQSKLSVADKLREDADRALTSAEYLEFMESKKEKGTHKAEEGDPNFDEMTPKQIVSYLEKRYKGDTVAATKAMEERINSLGQGMTQLAAQTDITICAIKHSDLGEALEAPLSTRTEEQTQLVKGMTKVAEENPTWGAEKCYRQAKLEIKANSEELDSRNKAKEEKERKALSEKGGISPASLTGKSIGKEEAAQIGWKAAFGNKD